MVVAIKLAIMPQVGYMHQTPPDKMGLKEQSSAQDS